MCTSTARPSHRLGDGTARASGTCLAAFEQLRLRLAMFLRCIGAAGAEGSVGIMVWLERIGSARDAHCAAAIVTRQGTVPARRLVR
jgi:hypothetical protein